MEMIVLGLLDIFASEDLVGKERELNLHVALRNFKVWVKEWMIFLKK